MPAGRPTDYNPKIAALICERISLGGKGCSLRSICQADDMPSLSSVFNWLRTEPLFVQQYEAAANERSIAIFEETIEIADNSEGDYAETEDGPVLRPENIQRARLRVDTRKWFLSKLNPKKYGDKIEIDQKVTTQHSDFDWSALDSAEIAQMRTLMAKASASKDKPATKH